VSDDTRPQIAACARDQQIVVSFRSDDATARELCAVMQTAFCARYAPTEESASALFKLGAEAGRHGNSQIREWIIMASWYCFEAVWSWRGRRGPLGVVGSIARRRARAESVLRQLNEEHEEWART
jgi:hypothetical protein